MSTEPSKLPYQYPARAADIEPLPISAFIPENRGSADPPPPRSWFGLRRLVAWIRGRRGDADQR